MYKFIALKIHIFLKQIYKIRDIKDKQKMARIQKTALDTGTPLMQYHGESEAKR